MNASEFRQQMSQLPEPKTDLTPPRWEFWRHQLWRLAQVDEVEKFPLWPCVYHTMLQNHWPNSIRYELSNLEGWRDEIVAPAIGPVDYLDDFAYSMNLIHQAYHLQQWERATGRRIEDLSSIVEFGGGYGAMCLLCRRLGFKGRYVIYDLPEFSLLQQWYLSQNEVEAEWPKGGKYAPDNVDLFMALYSVSEVEPKFRDAYIIPAKSYLFLYSGQWEQWNNVEYFQQDFPLLGHCANWRHTELSHLPDRNNWYSLGW